MKPLLKWPGGKSGEIKIIKKYIPSYDRYVEPFFGGGAMFFHLQPKEALINDISKSLMDFYKLIKSNDNVLYDLLLYYNNSFSDLIIFCEANYSDILKLYNLLSEHKIEKKELENNLLELLSGLSDEIHHKFSNKIIFNKIVFFDEICKMTMDKMYRTIKNNKQKPFSKEDLKSNLITGFASGYYMYFRSVYNDMNLRRIKPPSLQYKIANFCFIREYCYGSMFRYNKNGEFNIPYGGISYNKKNFKDKIENMFNEDIQHIFKNTDIECMDFENFVIKSNLTENDFMFLDPPYDTDFSDYEGKAFTHDDQKRLASLLGQTAAKFILVIKNTDFIYSLYKDKFKILSFDNQYTYNVRSRNERKVEHLLITNLDV